jgi:hypothetical protein
VVVVCIQAAITALADESVGELAQCGVVFDAAGFELVVARPGRRGRR